MKRKGLLARISLLIAGGKPKGALTHPASASPPPEPNTGVTLAGPEPTVGTTVGPATVAGRTMAEPTGEGGEQLQQAEDRVALDWASGDVIVDLYEVKPLNEAEGIDYAEGGFGRVYRVHHRAWNMDLAVKSPLAERFENEQQKADFTAECETWIDLGLHPHIVSCYYVRQLGGVPRVFAEFVEGGSLKDWIGNDGDGRLYEGGHEAALKRILDIAVQFAWGLNYAHEKGLVHQDIKPGNVMMTPDGTAKVTDFGLAKAHSLGASRVSSERMAGRSMIVPGAGSYTPEYAAPEQLSGGELSRRADIWAWAVAVFEMFVGGLYWRGSQVVPGQLEQYPAVDAEIPQAIPPMPDGLKQLLLECLSANADQRPRNMMAVVERLLDIYRDSTGHAYPRSAPKEADLLADGMNNRALSYLDLGKMVEAETEWEHALAAHPGHVAATYNLGLTRWREGKVLDVDLLESLRESAGAGGGALAEYAIGQIHLERLDVESAFDAFETAQGHGGELALETSGALDSALAVADAGARCVGTFKGHTLDVTSVCLSADGLWALSGSSDAMLKLWDVANGRCVRTFEGHAGAVNSVSLSGDGRWALSASSDNTLKLWEVGTGECARSFKGHKDTVAAVCLSVDGRWALSGSGGYEDNTVRLWDVATGQSVRTFEGHADRASSVHVSDDARWVLSGSRDGTLKLWEVSTGHCVRTFEGHTGNVDSVCLSADGRWALSGGGDGTVRLWELDWDYEFLGWSDWDEGARPYLENFLTLHTPYAAQLPQDREPTEEEIKNALTRRGKPTWTDDDFKQLLHTLACAGYGWLRPEGVKREMEKIAADWQGLPPWS